MVDQSYNFTDPVELVVLFREPKYRESSEEDEDLSPEQLEDLGIKVAVKKDKTEYNEYAGKIHVLWEDINSIKSFPFEDDWNKYKGDKFYVNVEGQGPEYLVLGSRTNMLEYWTAFRNRYARFR